MSGARKSCSRLIRIDRPRVVHVLERIAANLDNLALVSNDPQFDKEQTRMILKHVTARREER